MGARPRLVMRPRSRRHETASRALQARNRSERARRWRCVDEDATAPLLVFVDPREEHVVRIAARVVHADARAVAGLEAEPLDLSTVGSEERAVGLEEEVGGFGEAAGTKSVPRASIGRAAAYVFFRGLFVGRRDERRELVEPAHRRLFAGAERRQRPGDGLFAVARRTEERGTSLGRGEDEVAGRREMAVGATGALFLERAWERVGRENCSVGAAREGERAARAGRDQLLEERAGRPTVVKPGSSVRRAGRCV